MRRGITLTVCFVGFTALLASDARADDFAPPPWVRGAPLSTAAEWEFQTDANGHTGPDGDSVATVEGGFGPPDVSIYGLPGVDPIWSPGDGDGQWSAPANDPIFMGFQISNWEDLEPVKFLRIQVTFDGPAPSIFGVSAIHQTDPVTIAHTGTTSFSPNHLLFEYEMHPNPFFETFELEIPAGGSVDQVVVDTISIPEPATMTLLAIGGLATLKRRTRKGDAK